MNLGDVTACQAERRRNSSGGLSTFCCALKTPTGLFVHQNIAALTHVYAQTCESGDVKSMKTALSKDLSDLSIFLLSRYDRLLLKMYRSIVVLELLKD